MAQPLYIGGPLAGTRASGEVPSVIGRYQLIERIGKGGMEQVFHARLQSIGGFERDVAVKVLLPEYSAEPDFIAMLLDEARIAGSILHPCVVGVLDVGRADELFYLVMEYVDGSDLRALLKATPHGRLKLPIALHIISEVLRGLEAVHGATDGEGVPRRIVHRDVSPANVLLDRAGLVKLGDFGIAHATSRLTQTRNGAVKGKLRYMAPEQLKAQPVDHRVDLYAVGVMLLEALFGSEACEPRRMSSHGPVFVWERARAPRNLPGDVADILDRALAIDPARRYPNAGAFRRDVAAALHHRAPGYSSTELAADIDAIAAEAHAAASDNTELATSPGESPFDVSDSSALFFEEQKPTVPFRPVPAELVLPSTAPFPQVEAERYVAPPDSGQIALLRGRPWKKVALAGAVTAAAVLSIVLAIALGSASSAAAPPLAAAPVAPRAPVVPVSRPATGTLDVEGPRGSLVMIGTTAYPPAPCRLELPAGHYQVKVRRGKRMRFVTRSVEILPGAAVTLRI